MEIRRANKDERGLKYDKEEIDGWWLQARVAAGGGWWVGGGGQGGRSGLRQYRKV